MAERSAIGQRLSSRFVAGNQVEDAIRVASELNRKNITVSVDNLGENVTNVEEARASAQLYHQLLDQMAANQLKANISLKLTHMGLDVDEQLARDLVSGLVQKAASMSPPNFVRVDMEGSPYTQRTLDFVHELHRMPGNGGHVGTVIQSYMLRAEADVEKLLDDRIRIRLCKGAYKEPPDVAFQKKSDVDANYQADEDAVEERRVPRASDARREYHQRSEGIRNPGEYSARCVRIPDAPRNPPRPAAKSGARRLAHARLRPLRHRVVPVLHAPPRRAPRERILYRQEYATKLARLKLKRRASPPVECGAEIFRNF